MSQKKKLGAIIFIPKSTFGQLDAYIPFPVQIAEEYKDVVRHFTIIISLGARKNLKYSSFHKNILNHYGTVHDLEDCELKLKGFHLMSKFLYLVFLFAKIRFKFGRIIVFTDMGKRTFKSNIITKTIGLFANIISFPSIQAPWNTLMHDRFDPVKYQKAFTIDNGKIVQPIIAPKTSICYFEKEIPYYLSKFPKTKFVPIGLPRLYKHWPLAKEVFAKKLIEQEFHSHGLDVATPKIVVLIASNPEYFWVPSIKVYFELVEGAIKAIRQSDSNIPIFISLKSKLIVKFKHYFENVLSFENIFFSQAPLVVLSSRTKFALSIYESSGVYEFLSSNIPCAEYSQYSSQWLETYDTQSAWADEPEFQVFSDFKALNKFIFEVFKEGHRCKSRIKLIEHYKHFYDENILDKITK